jgi:hypothetical protein
MTQVLILDSVRPRTVSELVEQASQPGISNAQLRALIQMSKLVFDDRRRDRDADLMILVEFLAGLAADRDSSLRGFPTSIALEAQRALVNDISGILFTSSVNETAARCYVDYFLSRIARNGVGGFNDPCDPLHQVRIQETLLEIWHAAISNMPSIDLREVERALLHTGHYNELVTRQMCRLVPEFYRCQRYRRQKSDPESLEWDGWQHIPPVRGGATLVMRVDEQDMLEQHMRAGAELFTRDCLLISRTSSSQHGIVSRGDTGLLAFMAQAACFRHELLSDDWRQRFNFCEPMPLTSI